MLTISSLFQTLLPRTDPNFKPSCIDRADYQKQTGKQADDNDPSWPIQNWWSPAAAQLPPDQLVPVLLWKGGLSTVSIPAGRLAKPNLLGDQTFAPYVVPFTNAMWVQNPDLWPTPNTFPSSWLSTDADVAALLALFPGATAQTGQECFPKAIFQLGNTPVDWKPTVIVFANGLKSFAGGEILKMYGANTQNGGGKFNPGKFLWNSDNSAIFWVPVPVPVGQSTAIQGTPCNPIPEGYKMIVVWNGITPTYEIVPIGSTPATITISGSNGDDGVYTLTPAGA